MVDPNDTSLSNDRQQSELGFCCIVALIGLIAAWLLLMPWIPGIAKHSLQRFHLMKTGDTQITFQRGSSHSLLAGMTSYPHSRIVGLPSNRHTVVKSSNQNFTSKLKQKVATN